MPPNYHITEKQVDTSPRGIRAYLAENNAQTTMAMRGGDWRRADLLKKAYDEAVTRFPEAISYIESTAMEVRESDPGTAKALLSVVPAGRKSHFAELGMDLDFSKNLSMAPAWEVQGYTRDQSEILATATRDATNEQAATQARVFKSVAAVAQKYGVPSALIGDTINEFTSSFGAIDVPASEQVKLFETSQRFGVTPGTLIDAERKVRSLVTDQDGTVKQSPSSIITALYGSVASAGMSDYRRSRGGVDDSVGYSDDVSVVNEALDFITTSGNMRPNAVTAENIGTVVRRISTVARTVNMDKLAEQAALVGDGSGLSLSEIKKKLIHMRVAASLNEFVTPDALKNSKAEFESQFGDDPAMQQMRGIYAGEYDPGRGMNDIYTRHFEKPEDLERYSALKASVIDTQANLQALAAKAGTENTPEFKEAVKGFAFAAKTIEDAVVTGDPQKLDTVKQLFSQSASPALRELGQRIETFKKTAEGTTKGFVPEKMYAALSPEATLKKFVDAAVAARAGENPESVRREVTVQLGRVAYQIEGSDENSKIELSDMGTLTGTNIPRDLLPRTWGVLGKSGMATKHAGEHVVSGAATLFSASTMDAPELRALGTQSLAISELIKRGGIHVDPESNRVKLSDQNLVDYRKRRVGLSGAAQQLTTTLGGETADISTPRGRSLVVAAMYGQKPDIVDESTRWYDTDFKAQGAIKEHLIRTGAEERARNAPEAKAAGYRINKVSQMQQILTAGGVMSSNKSAAQLEETARKSARDKQDYEVAMERIRLGASKLQQEAQRELQKLTSREQQAALKNAVNLELAAAKQTMTAPPTLAEIKAKHGLE